MGSISEEQHGQGWLHLDILQLKDEVQTMGKKKKNRDKQQDQSMVVAKNSRLATMSVRNKLNLVISNSIRFEGCLAKFQDIILADFKPDRQNVDSCEFDVIISCTGYQTQFEWLDAEIDLNPRTWFKHCF